MLYESQQSFKKKSIFSTGFPPMFFILAARFSNKTRSDFPQKSVPDQMENEFSGVCRAVRFLF
jgi:hypothetical protein